MIIAIIWAISLVVAIVGTLFVVKNNPKVLSAVEGFNSFIKKVKNIGYGGGDV